MQCNLFTSAASPRARHTDPATSHAAAESMQGTAKLHRELIYGALHDYGDLTAEEAADRCGLHKVQANRRMKEMFRMGLVAPTGETRRTEAGRQARVWRVC